MSTITPILDSLTRQMRPTFLQSAGVISWSCPVPVFGDLATARVATLGLNPSGREFLDLHGCELSGDAQRFPTLRSLGLTRWSDARLHHLDLIAEECRTYFHRRPYDRWFRRLDQVLADTECSYYAATMRACHLDLAPFATERNWSLLRREEQELLLRGAQNLLAALLRISSIQVLVLNGASVVSTFQRISGPVLSSSPDRRWTLPRSVGPSVMGIAYTGTITHLGGEPLGRQIHVLGYNHNIQSSFGVTRTAISGLRGWIGKLGREVLS